MAIDPNPIATEQTQRAALAAGGAPTEMAGSPADAVRLAGGGWGDVIQLLNKLPPNVSDNAVIPTANVARQTPAGPANSEVGAAPTVTSDAPTVASDAPTVTSDAPVAPIELPSRVPGPGDHPGRDARHGGIADMVTVRGTDGFARRPGELARARR